MIFKKGMNKKGQDLTIGTLVLIVLGVVVLVLLIVGFTKGWGFIFDKFDSAPGKSLETTIQACNFAGQGGLQADYCLEFKRVSYAGETRYVNCEADIINPQLTTPLGSPCAPVEVDKAIKTFCYTTISGNDFASVKINGVSCFGRFASECIAGDCPTAPSSSPGKIKKNDAGNNCCFSLSNS